MRDSDSYRDLPRPGGTNLFVVPRQGPEEMMGGLEEGSSCALRGRSEGHPGRGEPLAGDGMGDPDGSCVGPAGGHLGGAADCWRDPRGVLAAALLSASGVAVGSRTSHPTPQLKTCLSKIGKTV